MKAAIINKAEEFVLALCKRSFLSPWCYKRPSGKGGKELCDVLVVCDPHVIIISVKEVALKAGEYSAIDYDRWERKAVDASVKQIYGADRWLASATRINRSDGSLGLELPPLTDRKVYRIAVAIGSHGEVCIKAGDFGKGFVHVMCERSFKEIMSELDTITDFIDYLAAKEAIISGGSSMIITGTESNLLGWYLANGRSFPSGHDVMIVDDTIWRGVKEKPEFKQKKESDRVSYLWDKLIEHIADPTAINESGDQLSDLEIAFRIMSRETRLSRRLLGRGVRGVFELAKARKIRSRILCGPSGVIYILAYFSAGIETKLRTAELLARCFVARHQVGRGNIVIGIGISEYLTGRGSASDIIYMNYPNWSNLDDERAVRMKNELDFFKDAIVQNRYEDEYPQSNQPLQ